MQETKISKKKPLILIFANYYLPGYKSGGGLRTIVNMVDRLKDRFDFWIVTRDHDGKHDQKQYKNVQIDDWNEIQGARVFYLSKENIRISKIRQLILDVKPDSIYLNSFFATLTIFVLKLRKLRLIPNINIILAPCGELSDGALVLKSVKKKIFLSLAKGISLYTNVYWKASTELEKVEIERLKPKSAKYFIAADLPPKHIFENYSKYQKPIKKLGGAKMVFLSRFMRKKNFKWLIENLGEINGELVIDIYGPLEDLEYWGECQKLIDKLPKNVKIEYKGSIPFEEVLQILFQYNFFIMPTLGENFGHIFLEALASGCPLIISNTTPWLDLNSKYIGWDLSLENAKSWNDVINYCVSMDNDNYQKLSQNAREFAVKWLADESLEKNTVEVLKNSLSNDVKYSD